MGVETSLRKTLVAIPSINGGRLLARMLPSLQIPGELAIVLDQGSTDETERICRDAGIGLAQLGRPHTYTEACNIAAGIARERGCNYLFIANNDVVLKTDVIRELLGELIVDPNLGIVAPSQIIVDEAFPEKRMLAYRVSWHLEAMSFAHDYNPPSGSTYRLESDFCELTFAGIRMEIIDKVGFLDNQYGFYHEDADFGFRLRQAGYTCAYLPNSQIEHWTSSTFAMKPSKLIKSFYIDRNKQLFARKFLGRYVHHTDHKSKETNSWNIINKNLHPYLRKSGLVRAGYPELIFSHPGTPPSDYLFTIWETSELPVPWLEFKDRYKLVMAPSLWGVDVLKGARFRRVHYVPLGVESDVFHPWGPRQRFADNKTFFWFGFNQYRKGLDVMLKAWCAFRRERPNARLVLMGNGILDAMNQPDSSRIWKQFRIAEYCSMGISVYETLAAVDEETLATIYRSVDFTVCSSRAEGFGFSVAESMACGTPAIFGGFSAIREFAVDGSLLLRGRQIRADYSDKGFSDVGDWWEPSVEHLTALLIEAHDMDSTRYRDLSRGGVRAIRTKFSWRATCFAIRDALIAEDEGAVAENEGARESVRITSTEPEVTSIRRKGFIARAVRRFGILCTFFGGQLEEHGIQYAIAASVDVVRPYMKSRAIWARQRTALIPWIARKHLPSPRKAVAYAQEPLEHRPGVLFVGYAEGALGLGQAFRANLAAAASAAIPFGIYPLRVGIETRLIEPYMPERYDDTHAYDICLIQVAADQLAAVFRTLDPRQLDESYKVLVPYWELAAAPEEWREKLRAIDEIWAPNEFIAKAFTPVFTGSILVMPPAMEPSGYDFPARAHYGLEESRFYFMFSFDYYSSPFRKNPLGVIEAFQQAFPKGDENVGLIIKSAGAPEHYPELKAAIRRTMDRDVRICLLDHNMSRGEMLGLIHATDAYVSLHRSEGFGLGMAEALSFGRIVIGTDYSGSTNFLNNRTGYPVPYLLRPVLPHEYHYSDGQSWAEPNLAEAVEIMRKVVADPEEARRRGAVGQSFVRERYGISPVGRLMKARLDKLASALPTRARCSASSYFPAQN